MPRRPSLVAAAALATLMGVVHPAGSETRIARGDAVAHVAGGLGLRVRGAEHLTGAVAAPLGPPSYRQLNRLLAGTSFALVFDSAGGGDLIVMIPGSAARPGAASRAPLWGAGDLTMLARTIGRDELGLLIAASADDDPGARLTAVAALAEHGVDALDILAAATHDPDAAVRFTAVQHLAAAGAPAAAHLAAAFRDGADGEIRALALSALSAADAAAARPLLATALRDRDPAVRRAAEALAAP